MSRTFFGTDGIRGRVGEDPITPEFFMKLAQAVGHHLLAHQAQATVVIGKDTRNSGYMLESALEAGFQGESSATQCPFYGSLDQQPGAQSFCR